VVKDDAGTTTVKSTGLLIEGAAGAGEQIPDEDR
jgi:hypothetical protein